MTDSFVFYRSFAEALAELEPDQYQAATKAIIDYALDDIEPEGLTGGAKITFIMAKPVIDANTQRRINGGKGGRPKKETNGFASENQRLQNLEPQPHHEDEEEDKDINKHEEGEGDIKEGTPEFITPTVRQIKKYFKDESLLFVDPVKFYDHFTTEGWLSDDGNIITDWRKAARILNNKEKRRMINEKH